MNSAYQCCNKDPPLPPPQKKNLSLKKKESGVNFSQDK